MWNMPLPSTPIGLHLALYGGVTIQDLAWEILGVDLEETPLPRSAAALPVIPKVMPHKRAGHNPKIYGYPWYVQQPIVPLHRPVPPSHPPPSHLLPSLSVKESDFTFQSSTSSLPLLAVNKSLKSLPASASTSSHAAEPERPVILKAAPGSQRTKVPLPQSSKAPSTAAAGSTDTPGQSEDEPLFMKPKELQQEGTKFQSDRPAQGFTLMGWQNPLGLWSKHLEKQIRSFTHPSNFHLQVQLRSRGVAFSELQAILTQDMAFTYGRACILPLYYQVRDICVHDLPVFVECQRPGESIGYVLGSREGYAR